ncbi:MAG: DsbE family thiol:disulfide interchange protein [Halofilum sp. (in: g-proteobacteria)]
MRYRSLIPLAIFVVIATVLGIGLTQDADEVPSPLIGKSVPAFELPGLRDPQARVGPADEHGRVWLLNVWGTWCVGCREEHDVLLDAAREHELTIVGLNYKDERDAAIDWLERLGDPYVASAYDPEGDVAMDLGVYGAPETYVVDANGIIRHKHIGPLSPADLRDTIVPLVRELEPS